MALLFICSKPAANQTVETPVKQPISKIFFGSILQTKVLSKSPCSGEIESGQVNFSWYIFTKETAHGDVQFFKKSGIS